MKFTTRVTYFSLILFSLAQFSKCQEGCNHCCGETPSQLDFLKLTKRLGIECVLNGEVKADSGNTIDAILSVVNMSDVCFKPLLRNIEDLHKLRDEDNRGSINEFDMIRKRVEIYCRHTNKLTKCLHPLHYLFRRCKQTEGPALFGLMKKACQNKGSKIVEFLSAGGTTCFGGSSEDKNSGENSKIFRKCLNWNFISKTNNYTDTPVNYIAKNFCQTGSDLRECVLESLGLCKNSKPKRLLDTFLNQFRKENPKGETCFFRKVSALNTRIRVTTTTPSWMKWTKLSRSIG